MRARVNVGNIRWFFKNIPQVADIASSDAKLVKIVAEKDKLILTNIDTYFGLNAIIEATVEDEGSVVILARYIKDALMFLPDTAEIVLYKDNNKVVIEFQDVVLRVPHLADSLLTEFPVAETLLFNMESNALLDAINATKNTNMLSNNTVFKGVLFDMGEKPSLVSTTGVILTHFDLKLDPLNQKKYFLDINIVNRLSKIILPNTTVNVYATGDSYMFFEFDSGAAKYKCFTAVLDLDFPSYRHLIDNAKKALRIDADLETLKASISRIGVAADSIFRAVSLTIEEMIDDSVLRISYDSSAAEAKKVMPVKIKRIIDENVFRTIALRVDFLSRALSVFNTDQISLYVYNEKTPLILEDNNNKTILIMGVVL